MCYNRGITLPPPLRDRRLEEKSVLLGPRKNVNMLKQLHWCIVCRDHDAQQRWLVYHNISQQRWSSRKISSVLALCAPRTVSVPAACSKDTQSLLATAGLIMLMKVQSPANLRASEVVEAPASSWSSSSLTLPLPPPQLLQILTVLSLLPLHALPPSALQSTAKTSSLCPTKSSLILPLSTSHTLSVVSLLALTSIRPSALQLHIYTAAT